MNGGYKLINLDYVNLVPDDEAKTIKGIYSAIESSLKAKLVTGIVIDSVEKCDVFTEFRTVGQSFKATLYGYALEIKSTDEVSLTTIE